MFLVGADTVAANINEAGGDSANCSPLEKGAGAAVASPIPPASGGAIQAGEASSPTTRRHLCPSAGGGASRGGMSPAVAPPLDRVSEEEPRSPCSSAAAPPAPATPPPPACMAQAAIEGLDEAIGGVAPVIEAVDGGDSVASSELSRQRRTLLSSGMFFEMTPSRGTKGGSDSGSASGSGSNGEGK